VLPGGARGRSGAGLVATLQDYDKTPDDGQDDNHAEGGDDPRVAKRRPRLARDMRALVIWRSV